MTSRQLSTIRREILRRSTQARSTSGATMSQNGSVAPKKRSPRANGTSSSRQMPTDSHASIPPIEGFVRAGWAVVRDSGSGRSVGDAENGAMSMMIDLSFPSMQPSCGGPISRPEMRRAEARSANPRVP
jgi:hypothetical protein